jgi:alpha-amylase/alpha-mannosidase (GH57 family)
MEKFLLYNCYHLNLAFSRIPEDHYSYVIDTCYWPFLEFCKKYNIRSGFEIPAFTLIEIEKRDKSFIREFKSFIDKGYAELIGAGFAQTIFPLIPAEVNMKNLEIGNKYYKEIIGVVPETAYINEQCYSSGLVELYLNAGYKISSWKLITP